MNQKPQVLFIALAAIFLGASALLTINYEKFAEVSPYTQTAAAIDEGIIYQRDAATSYTASGPGTDIGDIGGGLNAITVSAWVEPSQTSGVYHIVSKYGVSDASWAIWYSGVSNAYLFTTLSSTGGYAQPFSILSNPGGLRHIVGVYDGSNSFLYINGVLVGNSPQPMTGSIKNTGIPVCIGSQGSSGCTSGSNFPGTISKVRIYNKALSASEVGELFTSQGGTTVEPPIVIPPTEPPVVIPPTDTQTNPPTVSITSPGSGTTISSSPTALSATAAAQSGKTIAGVQFKYNGTNIGSEDTSAPYTASWTSTGFAAGSYAITATARDSAGVTTISSPITLIVPGVTVTPAARRTVSWTAPVGIPEPPFGIREDVTHFILRGSETCSTNPEKCYNYGSGIEPYRLNPQGEPYTHWVDGTPGGGCAGFNNESLANHLAGGLGTPSAPLCRLPLNIPAGSIVEVHGLFQYSHNTATVQVYGTAMRPVFIRTTDVNRANVTGTWEISGSYGIIENFLFRDEDNNAANGGVAGSLSIIGGDYGSVVFKSHHISVRHNEISGNINTIGINATPLPDRNNPYDNYNVIWDNYVHHTGEVLSPVDKDVGGIKVAGKWLWAIDNKCHDNGNACVFTGGGNGDHVEPLNDIQYVFIGRNNGYRNREANFFTKQASHVVFSENISGVSYDLRGPGLVDRAGGMGFQYGPRDVWFINNTIHDGKIGIVVGGDGVEATQDSYFIGNVIYNIHKNLADITPQGAINIGGGLNHHIINNTIYDTDLGIYILNGRQNNVVGNIVSNITGNTSLTSHLLLQNEVGKATQNVSKNLFYQPGGAARVLNTNVVINPNSEGIGSGNIEDNPDFVNASQNNFALQSTSPARDVGTATILNEIVQRYQQTYGVDIRKDIMGNNRTLGSAIDIGAYEYCTTNCTAPQQPQTPTLTIQKQGTGAGTINGNVLGIACSLASCPYSGANGTQVTLTAAPGANSSFIGWSGGVCTGTAPCTFTLSSSITVAGVFNKSGINEEDPPVISNINASPITSSGAIITWTTNSSSTSQVRFGLTTNYGSVSALITTLLSDHRVSLIRLLPNTTYHFQVISRDAAGNTSTSTDRTFTTLASGVAVLPPAVATNTPPVILGATTTAVIVRTPTSTANLNMPIPVVNVNLPAPVAETPLAPVPIVEEIAVVEETSVLTRILAPFKNAFTSNNAPEPVSEPYVQPVGDTSVTETNPKPLPAVLPRTPVRPSITRTLSLGLSDGEGKTFSFREFVNKIFGRFSR